MQSQVHYFAPVAFLPTGWANNVLIKVDRNGWITSVEKNVTNNSGIMLNGPVLPGMSNVHSHAFQRAMAGFTERATGAQDSFWTWREIMYRFLEKLTPEDQHAIAAQVYIEMLKAGYTTVGEFHYLHHQADGKPYQDRSLTSRHIIMAAKEAGISITHMPVLYVYSGFGKQEPTESQRRFINNETQILDMIAQLSKDFKDDPQVTLGLGLHSLRAVSPDILQPAVQGMKDIHSLAPIHIHIAEQMQEVNDCVAWSGQRPVEWLLNHVNIDKNWCLVHATHMTEIETRRLAQSGAVAGLCPTTEANLGDGLFNLPNYIKESGNMGIGSDSNISVSVIEELRLLEYGQRLLRHERNIVKIPGESSVGFSLYSLTLAGGAQALSRSAGEIAVGKRADFIALDPQVPTLLGKENNYIFDGLIFAGNVNPIRHVISGGQHVVKDFQHVAEENIYGAFCQTMKKMRTPSY